MKKIIALLLVFIMLLSLFSCVEKKPDTTSDDNAETTTIPKNDDLSDQTAHNELAKENFAKAIRNEINVYYPLNNNPTPHVTYFSSICSSTKGVPTRQAMIDIDQDGIEELILGYESFFILLDFQDDVVYATDLNPDFWSEIYTDGSFYWSICDVFGYECGISRISFVNGIKKIEDLCREVGDSQFFINNVQVTEEEYKAYVDSLERTPITFSPFYSSFLTTEQEKAVELASAHWGIHDGDIDPERGFRYRVVYSYEADNIHRVSLYRFIYASYEQLEVAFVNIETGEISSTKYPDGKG